jgi:RNA binding exosome subunit
MDLSILATEITAYLAPFLPYLVKAGSKAAEKAGEKFTGVAWEKAQSMWAKLSKKDDVERAAKDVVEMPEDEDAQAALRLQVKKQLQEDDSLMKELTALLKELKPLVGGDHIEMDVRVSGQAQVRDIIGKQEIDKG